VKSYSLPDDEGPNPYIALSDLVICSLLVVVFFVALGRLGLVNVRYKHSMDEFAKAVQRDLPASTRPRWEQGRNDPPGVQRWVFDGRDLFAPGGADAAPILTADGGRVLSEFARLLKANRLHWSRIRVEGHTTPPNDNRRDDWELSVRRAAAVVRQIQAAGDIPPWYFAVAGRAGQNPLHKIILFAAQADPAIQNVEHQLRATGVSFSEKPLAQAAIEGLTADPDARRYLMLVRGFHTSCVVEANDDGADDVFNATDTRRLDRVIKRFPFNERV
jgi:chemotaxis protein MotB